MVSNCLHSNEQRSACECKTNFCLVLLCAHRAAFRGPDPGAVSRSCREMLG